MMDIDIRKNIVVECANSHIKYYSQLFKFGFKI